MKHDYLIFCNSSHEVILSLSHKMNRAISMNFKTKKILDFHLFDDDLEKVSLENKTLVNTINQYSYCVAERDHGFKESLLNSDVLLPDGMGIVWALNFLKGEKIKKIAGADCHEFLLRYLNENNGSCFYLGASEETLQKICKKNTVNFPNIRVGSYSPPFKSEFSEEDNLKMLEKISDFQPDVLFIGMTAPKQEKWAYKNLSKIDAGTICSIGAVFDFYAGTIKKPGKFWVNIGLEWLIRLIMEPKRLWKRYIYYGFVFTLKIIALKFKPKE